MKIELEFTCEKYNRKKLTDICTLIADLFDNVIFTKVIETAQEK